MKRIVITLGIAVLALAAATAALAGTLTTTATVSGTAGISLQPAGQPLDLRHPGRHRPDRLLRADPRCR